MLWKVRITLPNRPGTLTHLARECGAAGADNQAVLPMVLGSGLRGRIRLAGEVLTVRIGLRNTTAAPWPSVAG